MPPPTSAQTELASTSHFLCFDERLFITACSAGIEFLTGLSATEVTGRSVSEALPFLCEPDDGVPIRRALRGEASFECERRFREHENGDQLIFDCDFVPAYDAAGLVNGGVVVLRLRASIIHKRMLSLSSEQTSHLPAKFIDSLVNSVGGILWEVDLNTFAFTFVSRQAERILGYPLNRWTDEKTFWQDHIHEEDREWAVAFCKRSLATQKYFDFEYRMIAADGRTLWIRDIVSVIEEEGSKTKLIGVMLDTTESVRAEEALRESEERYRALVTASSQVVWRTDDSGEAIFTSRTWQEMTGQSDEEMRGHGWLDAVHPDDRKSVIEAWMRAVAERSIYHHEFRVRTRDGNYHHYESRGVPIFASGGGVREWIGANTDITERKLVEKALRESLERNRTLLANIPDQVMILNRQGLLLYANRTAGNLDAREAFGADAFVGLAPAARAEALLAVERVFTTGEISELEAADRNENSYSIRFVPLKRDGLVLSVLTVITDITERKIAERELRESEERLRRAFLGAPLPIALYTSDGEFLQLNHAWTQISGYTIDETPTVSDWLRKVAGYGLEANAQQALPRFIEEDGRIRGGEMVIVTKCGDERVWEFSSGPLGEWPEGRLIYISRAVELTERRQAEEERRRADRRAVRIFESITDGFLAFDREWRFTYVNAAAEQFLRRSRERLLGKVLWDELPESAESAFFAHLRDAMNGDAPVAFEESYPTFESWLFVRLYPSEDGLSVYFTDITRRKEAEAALHRLMSRLTNAQEDERRRIARELHDGVGQIISAVGLRLRMIESKSQSTGVERLQTQLGELAELLEKVQTDMRSMAHSLHPSVLEHLGLAQAVRSFMSEQCAPSGVEYSLDIPDELPRFAPGTETAIYRIVQEAVANALRHSHANHISLTICVRSSLLIVTVSDDGCGFSTDRVETSGGLGLVSMKERAEAAGAEIEFISYDGRGTKIRLYLPLSQMQSELEVSERLLSRDFG